MDKKKEIRISKFENLRTIGNKIKEIYLSLLLQTLTQFQSLTSKLLPLNTKRKEIYDFAILSFRILKLEGFELFIHQVRNRTFKKYIKSSKIPIVESKIIQPNTTLSLIKTVQGKFSFPAKNLNKINIFTTTSHRLNSKIKLQIIDEKEMLIRESVVRGSEVKNKGYTSFKFKPIKESKDKVFYFKLKSIGEPSASVWYEEIEEVKELTLFYDSEYLNGKIGFQAFSNLGIQYEYDLWMLRNNLTATKKERYKKEAQNFAYRPKISIIMPVYNVDKIWLEKAIDSVRNQLYTNWELCIADDASTKPHIKSTLDKYSKIDSRVKIKYLSNNLGISGASNESLFLATGEFIGLLDNDDELSIDALYEVIKILNKKSDIDFIYSDEDKIDMEGTRCKPFFKPGWSPDILFSVNYICHFAVIRKKVVDEVGKFRLGFEGSQDYDLFLRVAEKTSRIEHIPKILYHWRMIPGSTALNIYSKDKAQINGIKSLQDYLKRQKIDGVVSSSLNRTNYQVDYEIKDSPLVSIIIQFDANVQYIKRCINNIFRNTEEIRYEILLMVPKRKEKQSSTRLDPTKKQPEIKILTYDESWNASAINNFAAEKSSGDYLLFLNSKIEITNKKWLTYLLMNAERPDIGCVCPKILNFDGTINKAGIVFGTNGEKCDVFSGNPENNWTNFGLDTWSRNYLAINGECLMINRNKFFQAGSFDKNLKDNKKDIDLCLKVHKKGFRNLCTATVCVYQLGACSRKEDISRTDLKEILKPDGTYIENGDPYYNPNLSLKENLRNLNLTDSTN
jgi:O-antigen biosynthesis protein